MFQTANVDCCLERGVVGVSFGMLPVSAVVDGDGRCRMGLLPVLPVFCRADHCQLLGLSLRSVSLEYGSFYLGRVRFDCW